MWNVFHDGIAHNMRRRRAVLLTGGVPVHAPAAPPGVAALVGAKVMVPSFYRNRSQTIRVTHSGALPCVRDTSFGEFGGV